MKYCTLILLLLSLQNFAQSQDIYSKDGVLLGGHDDFVKMCTESADDVLMNLDGVSFNTVDYCSCVASALLPSLTSTEIMEASENDNIMELLLGDENIQILMNCLEGNYEIEDDFVVGDLDLTGVTEEVSIAACVSEIMNDTVNIAGWSKELSTEYCTCAIRAMRDQGFTYGELKDIENLDSEAFNEIVLPCFTDEMLPNRTFSIDPIEIDGDSLSSSVPLIDYLGQGYKLKMTIDGKVKYFLLDTGASDLIINGDLERLLIEDGSLKETDYLGVEVYSMANNDLVEARLVRLESVVIGGYTLNNVVAAIIEDGSLLCGKGFLDNFSDWEIKKDEKLLVIHL